MSTSHSSTGITSNQEDTMSTDTSSTQSSTPSSGASNGSTNGTTTTGDAMSTDSSNQSSTSSSGASNGSTSTSASGTSKPGTAPPAKDKELKRPYAGRYLRTREKERADKALAAAQGMTDPSVQAEQAVVRACLQAVQEAQGTVLGCVASTQSAKIKLDAAEMRLRPAVYAARWTLRMQPQGRAFAKSLNAKTDALSAQRILDTVPSTPGFRLSPDALKEIRDALPDVEAAEQVVLEAEGKERDAAANYNQAIVALGAATAVLNGAIKAVKFRARIPAAAQPARGSVRMAKSAAAHSKRKDP